MLTKERLDELLAYDPETGWFTWRVRTSNRVRVGATAGTPHYRRGYILVRIDGRRYSAHRLAFLTMTGCWPEDEVDHINGDPADNRWTNLRQATHLENGRNLRKMRNNTSGVTGVFWSTQYGKWCSEITAARKKIQLGYCTAFDEAVSARRAAEVEYFGEFSPTASRGDLTPDSNLVPSAA